MRLVLILGLATVLFIGCSNERDNLFKNASVNDLETAEVLCQTSIMVNAVDVGTAQERAETLLHARDRCKNILSNDKSFTLVAAAHVIEKFDNPDDVRLKDIFIRDNSRAPYQKELAGKISVKNEYGDFSSFKYFNVYVDNATFNWVLNFEEIRN